MNYYRAYGFGLETGFGAYRREVFSFYMSAPGRKAGGLYGGINLSSTTVTPAPIIEAAPVLAATENPQVKEKEEETKVTPGLQYRKVFKDELPTDPAGSGKAGRLLSHLLLHAELQPESQNQVQPDFLLAHSRL